jgi:hypothetical protein
MGIWACWRLVDRSSPKKPISRWRTRQQRPQALRVLLLLQLENAQETLAMVVNRVAFDE